MTRPLLLNEMAATADEIEDIADRKFSSSRCCFRDSFRGQRRLRALNRLTTWRLVVIDDRDPLLVDKDVSGGGEDDGILEPLLDSLGCRETNQRDSDSPHAGDV